MGPDFCKYAENSVQYIMTRLDLEQAHPWTFTYDVWRGVMLDNQPLFGNILQLI